jgi:4'-phosphopantetheinyl transferase
MPLYLEKRIDGSRLAVWQMTETVEELFGQAALSEGAKSEVENFRSETRKKEWLTLRILLKDVLGVAHYDDIVYDEKGKPHLKNGRGYISFSHTRNFAAVIFHNNKNMGIDIETVRERIEKISHKFVNDEEQAFLQNEKRIEMLHIIWGCKEVLFKLYGKGGLDFKKQMYVHPFVPVIWGDSVNAELKTDEGISRFKINYFFLEKLVVVYASS